MNPQPIIWKMHSLYIFRVLMLYSARYTSIGSLMKVVELIAVESKYFTLRRVHQIEGHKIQICSAKKNQFSTMPT